MDVLRWQEWFVKGVSPSTRLRPNHSTISHMRGRSHRQWLRACEESIGMLYLRRQDIIPFSDVTTKAALSPRSFCYPKVFLRPGGVRTFALPPGFTQLSQMVSKGCVPLLTCFKMQPSNQAFLLRCAWHRFEKNSKHLIPACYRDKIDFCPCNPQDPDPLITEIKVIMRTFLTTSMARICRLCWFNKAQDTFNFTTIERNLPELNYRGQKKQ